jgi:hypothetical protein
MSYDQVRVSFLKSFPKVHLEITGIVGSDQDHEVIKAGKITVIFNLRKIIHDSVDIQQVVIRDASINLFTDVHGGLTQLFSSQKSNPQDSEKSMSFSIREILVYNFRFRSENRVKKNMLRFEVTTGSFLVDIDKPLTRLTAKFKGRLDSLTSRGTLILTNLAAGSDKLVVVNDDERKVLALEQGIIMAENLELKPSFSLSKQEDGKMIDWSIRCDNDLNDFLSIFNMKAGKDLKQTNPDAKATLIFSQKGIISANQNPYTELDFAISDAKIESNKITYPVTDLFISGNYNNGENHSSQSASIRIDTLHARIGDSFLEGKANVYDLKDPQISAKLTARFDLRDIIKPTDLFSAAGLISANVNINSRLNAFEKDGITGKDLASGEIDLQNLDFYLQDSSYRVQIKNGQINLKNQLLSINRFYGTLNNENFYIEGQLTDFNNLVEKQKIEGKINAGFDHINLKGPVLTDKPDTTSSRFMKFLLSHLVLSLNASIEKLTGQFGEMDDIDLHGNWEEGAFSIQELDLNYKGLVIQGDGLLSFKNSRLDSISGLAGIHGKRIDLQALQEVSNLHGKGSEKAIPVQIPKIKLQVRITIDTLQNGKTLIFNLSGSTMSSTNTFRQSQTHSDGSNDFKTEFSFAADKMNYNNIMADSILVAGNFYGGKTEIKRCLFNYAGGNLSLEGILHSNVDQTTTGNFNSSATGVDVKQILSSFGNFGQSFLTDENVSGKVSWTADLYFRLDSNFNPIDNDNLWKFNFKMTDSQLSNVVPVENALSFIRQKSKEDILISDLEFTTFFTGKKLYFQDVAIKNSISDMNIFGTYSTLDTVADLNLQISLSDLLFKSLKKRMIETEEGLMDVGKDKNINLKFTGTIGQHHVKPIVRKEFIKQKAFMQSQFDEFDVELQKRMAELSGGDKETR